MGMTPPAGVALSILLVAATLWVTELVTEGPHLGHGLARVIAALDLEPGLGIEQLAASEAVQPFCEALIQRF